MVEDGPHVWKESGRRTRGEREERVRGREGVVETRGRGVGGAFGRGTGRRGVGLRGGRGRGGWEERDARRIREEFEREHRYH